mmetsp:Transcript_21144/g.29613  ORF Transcript_21144/g.29613 Transcript_21144/m.29613 type:complete len:631 (-) Transcript_21144:160-2052(-)
MTDEENKNTIHISNGNDEDNLVDEETDVVESKDINTTSAYDLPVGDVFCWRQTTSIRSFFELTWKWLLVNKSQILSGITVALAQVPEAVSFSFVAGVDPIVGLQSAWIMGICTSLFGGRPGMVAGATGAVAVVLPKIVKDHGIGYMFYAVMLAGIIEILFGLLRLGKLIRLIPHPVMVGFVNGLGIVIGVAQFNIFKVREDDSLKEVSRNLLEVGGAFSPFTNGLPWVNATMGFWMAFHIVIALLTYAFFPKLTKAIPASLASIIVTTILEWALVRPVGYRTNTVKDLASVSGSFPIPVWADNDYKDLMPPLNGHTLGIITPVAFTVAAISLLESLLTLEIIDELTNTKGNGNREAFGQGLGQLLSGLGGGMGGCTTIGQSLMNIHSGGYTRLSSSVAAIFMLIIILAAYHLINLIPVAGLAGVMFVVTYFTIEWESAWIILSALLPMKYRLKYGLTTKVKRTDVFVMLSVVAVTLILDLAIAVGVGLVLSSLIFAWDSGNTLTFDRQASEDGTKVVYSVGGPIFFGSIKPLLDIFPNPRDEPKDVTILFNHADIHDWSGMVAIKKLHDRFERNGATSVKFKNLNVASHKLMEKGKGIWEGADIYKIEDVDVEHDPLVEHNHYDGKNPHL